MDSGNNSKLLYPKRGSLGSIAQVFVNSKVLQDVGGQKAGEDKVETGVMLMKGTKHS